MNVHEVSPPQSDGELWSIEGWNEKPGEAVVLPLDNTGPKSSVDRLENDHWSKLERQFAKYWAEANDRSTNRSVNYGHGILQDLMFKSFDQPRVSGRERKIVAMVIQWLGSNVGRSWFEKVLDSVGIKMVEPRAPASAYRQDGKVYSGCPNCGRADLRTLTWKELGIDETSLGCWDCSWITYPDGVTAEKLAGHYAKHEAN